MKRTARSKTTAGTEGRYKSAHKKGRATGPYVKSYKKTGQGAGSVSVFQAAKAPEKKVIDTTTAVNPVVAGTGTAPALLNGVAQGLDYTQRIGRVIRMTSLYWQWEGTFPNAGSDATPVRLTIVYDKEAEGAAPTIAAAAQTDMYDADSIVAMNNLNNRDRFITLLDEIVECVGAAGPQSFFRKGYRKIGLPVVFNGAAGTVAAINTGSIYAQAWINTAVGGVASVPTTLRCRIRFTDE